MSAKNRFELLKEAVPNLVADKRGAHSMSSVLVELEIPGDIEQFKLPPGVNDRLQELLDRQDSGETLSSNERKEAEGLVELAEMLSLLRLRAQRASGE